MELTGPRIVYVLIDYAMNVTDNLQCKRDVVRKYVYIKMFNNTVDVIKYLFSTDKGL